MKREVKKRTRMTDANRDPENRDPITGAPGAHPVGTGIGAAAGGATGAAIGAVGGPAGAAVGLVAGGIIGGLAGKAGGESVNPTVEDAYWRETHKSQPYGTERSYDQYANAYRTGYEGYSKYGCCGKDFDECEPQLMADYDQNKGDSDLSWQEAKPACKAAWERLSEKKPNTNTETAAADMDAPRYASDPSSRDLQQATRYEPKERSKR